MKLTFAAEKPPPAYIFIEVALMAAEEKGNTIEHFGVKSLGAAFAIIDIAARPEVQFHYEPGGKFSTKKGYSTHVGKRKFLSFLQHKTTRVVHEGARLDGKQSENTPSSDRLTSTCF